MWADFVNEYQTFYDTTEAPDDGGNGQYYIYEEERAVLSMDEPDTPEWAIVKVEE